MGTTLKTDRQTLLAAVRKGDFGALLSLADLWEEEGCDQARRWANLVKRAQWHVANRERLRMGVLESMARWVRDWAYGINRIEGKPWRLPKSQRHVGVYRSEREAMTDMLRPYVRTWDWCRDMADKLIRHVKVTP